MRMRILDFQGQSPLSAAYGLVLQSRRCLSGDLEGRWRLEVANGDDGGGCPHQVTRTQCGHLD